MEEDEELRHLHEGSHEADQSEDRSRPTTPKWWRPPIPPETYLWEEIRRKRQQGGYPWTLLDKDLRDLGDNLYEPVNPPPLYGSKYNVRKDPDSTSLDERMIEIPPEIEIITSEGLDGLDQPDPHDALGVDGDREWHSFHHDHDDPHLPPKATFTAGIRNQELPKVGETSSVRPLTNKTITFSPDVPADDVAAAAAAATSAAEVPSDKVPTEPATEEPGTSKPSALEQLKSKAGQVKQRISKISLPVRPKFNQWTGIKLSKRKKDPKKTQAHDEPPDEDDQQVPEGGGWTEPLSLVPEAERQPPQVPTSLPPSEPMDVDQVVPAKPPEPLATITEKIYKKEPASPHVAQQPLESPDKSDASADEISKKKQQQQQQQQITVEDDAARKAKLEDEAQRKKLAEEEKKRKDEELKRLKAEEKLQREREQEEVKRLKEQEKLQRQKEQEELKRLKAEEKLRKEKEAEEQKRLKAEEKLRKEKEKEELKRQKEEEKLRQQKLQEELKRAQEEEIRKAKELEDEFRQANASTVEDHDHPDHQDHHRKPDDSQQSPPPPPPSQHIFAEPPGSPTVTVEPPAPTTTTTAAAKTPEKKRKLIDMDFTKRFKRSKTPPPRPQPPTIKLFSRKPKTPESIPQNQLAAQYANELEVREAAAAAMDDEPEQEDRLREPQIFVTQPSIETESEAASDIVRPSPAEPLPRRTQRVVYDADAEEYEEEVDDDEDRVPTPSKSSQNRENLDKIGRKIKGFGIKSKAIAAQTGKNLGQTMKVLGHGIKEFGVNAVQEVKAKQEAVRQRDAQRKAEQENAAHAGDGGSGIGGESTVEPSSSSSSTKFRFRKRSGKKPPLGGHAEGPMALEELPEEREAPATPHRSPRRRIQRDDSQPEEDESETKVHRSQLLGRAERDWESPLDLAQSRDASEEPFSGNASSRDSPPGSSMASSSIMPGRRHGVLEEIDSDEFFLRERGISEGEDEEEVNRFLVEELRQAFRPNMANALAGFDLEVPPERPERSPRKPPRKGKSGNASFQTFPPERPKRQRAPGYISSYINANPDEEFDRMRRGDEEEEEGLEDVSSIQEEMDEDEALSRVKEELRKIDQDLEAEEEEDGRYEPVNDEQQVEPVKPARRRKGRKLPPPSDTGFYYNTIAANEWMRDIEDQIEVDDGPQPVPPKRVKSKSGSLCPDIDDSEINFADDDLAEPGDQTLQAVRAGPAQPPLAQAESAGQIDGASPDLDDGLDYVDEAGYAVVHKDASNLPKTFPRKKRRARSGGHNGSGSKGNSLKRRSQDGRQNGSAADMNPPNGSGGATTFFSLPRYTPRTFHIVPPTRPHRTYSTLRPKRPPRSKTKSNQNLEGAAASPAPSPRPTTPASPASRRDMEDRPSSAITGIQGRPLPPPPRPQRSPAPLNDLDQASLERMVNVRHYANFEEDSNGMGGVEVHEEPFTATNIPLLHGRESEEVSSTLANSDINVAVQTDPIQDEEYELNIAVGSFEEELERIEKESSASQLLPDDQDEQGEEVPPPIPERPLARPPQPTIQAPQLIFPTRLHLDELEVDHLRVNELTANSLSLTQIHAPHLELNTLSSRGPLSIPSIQAPNITVDHIDCRRISSDAAEVPSVPPPSFYSLSSPPLPPSLCPEHSVDSVESHEDVCDSTCPAGESEQLPEGEQQQQQQQQRVSVNPSSPPVSTASRNPPLSHAVSRTSSTHTADPDLEDIAHLSVRLGRALLRVTVRSLHAMAEYVEMAASNDPQCQEQQRANMQVLMCLLLVLVAGIILISRTGGVEPRWQYFLPPSDI